jgi:hypothetical protein
MSSQPGGGPAIPAAAALSGLASREGQDTTNTDQEDGDFLTGGTGGGQTDDGVPVGSADAEQDRLRAGEESEEQSDG